MAKSPSATFVVISQRGMGDIPDSYGMKPFKPEVVFGPASETSCKDWITTTKMNRALSGGDGPGSVYTHYEIRKVNISYE